MAAVRRRLHKVNAAPIFCSLVRLCNCLVDCLVNHVKIRMGGMLPLYVVTSNVTTVCYVTVSLIVVRIISKLSIEEILPL